MRSILVLLALAAASTVAATSNLETIERALAGDLEALESYLEGFDDPNEITQRGGIVRGLSLRASGQMDEAVQAWEQAVAEGARSAVRILVWHHLDQEQWLEAYGWSQLAMEVTALEQNLNRNQLGGNWTLYGAMQAAEGLDPSQHDEADRLARSRIQTFGPALAASYRQASEIGYGELEPIKRTAPRYPRSLFQQGTPGWAYALLAINEDGRVERVISLAATDSSFARAAERAIRKWRFETGNVEEFPVTAQQLVEFALN